MIKVVVLGSGNVATHLIRVFLKADGIDLVQVYNRNIKNSQYLKKKVAITDDLETLKDADIYIISISDDAISEFSSTLNLDKKLVVHTSGSVAMNDLVGGFNTGVFYPLQTFSKNKKIKFKKVPICIEASTKTDLDLLEKLAASISKNVYFIDSEKRKNLHLSAVFVNNFVNHLYHIGAKICTENEVSFDILKPIILETAKKVQKLAPKDAQTGPAKRNDVKIIEKQISQLKGNQQEIYKIVTASILKIE